VSNRWVLVLAVSAAVGALAPTVIAVVVPLTLVVSALCLRRPLLLCLAVGLLVSALAEHALDGLQGAEPAVVDGEVTLLTDPAPAFGGIRADVLVGERHVEARASGAAAEALRERLAGERIRVRGELTPVEAPAPWLVVRHVGARLQVLAVDGWRPGAVSTRVANGFRRTLQAGAELLGPERRSLFTGLVIGDDREQPVELGDDFQGAGLTHLLAVSGQNVAFVLVLAGPLLRRLRLWPRLAASLAAIGLFAVMTRMEPSVLRASVMAAVAVATTTIGRPQDRLRILGLAVTALLVLDPLLVRSVGFQLSVAAAGAIVVAAPALTAALPGPLPLREALAVTLAAQLGVAPVLVSTFGPVPVASIPANLLAVPVAGIVMVWGLTGGFLAGLLGHGAAEVLHLPTALLLGWLQAVARRAAAAPLGELRIEHLITVALGLGVAVAARRWPRTASTALPRAGLSLATAAVLIAVVQAHAPPALRTMPAPGVTRWHSAGTEVVVLGGTGGGRSAGAKTALEALRGAGVGAIDLLVLADASVDGEVVHTIEARHPLGAVAVLGAPEVPGVQAPVVRVPRPSAQIVVGALEVRFVATADRLVVEAVPATDRAAEAEGGAR
jgi:competence protein ComEC